MDCEMIKVNDENKETLKCLTEYYLYEFSEFYNFELNENGRFEIIDVDRYLKNDGKEAFIIKKNNKIAGFIFIADNKKYKTIEEFWITRKYRSGIFAYVVIKELALAIKGKIEFIILNKNERYLKCVKYMLKKYDRLYKTISVNQIPYEMKWGGVEMFTRFLIDTSQEI